MVVQKFCKWVGLCKICKGILKSLQTLLVGAQALGLGNAVTIARAISSLFALGCLGADCGFAAALVSARGLRYHLRFFGR